MENFKVLNIEDSHMGVTNQRIAIIELVTVDYIDLSFSGSEKKVYTYGVSGERFIIDFNSNLTKSIIRMAENEEIISLDLSDFTFRNESINGINERIAYHKNVHLTGF